MEKYGETRGEKRRETREEARVPRYRPFLGVFFIVNIREKNAKIPPLHQQLGADETLKNAGKTPALSG